MNLGLLESQLYGKLGWPSTPQTTEVTRLRGFLNETHRELLGRGAIGPNLRRALVTFTTVSGSPFAVLPQAAVMLFGISDRTNNNFLSQYSISDVRFQDPGLVSSGSAAYGFVAVEYAAAVTRDPSDASEIFAKSTAADTRTAYLEGVRSNGQYVSLSKVLNGTTAVSFSATFNDIILITKFYLSASDAANTVTLLEDSGAGTELSRIAPGRTYARYTRLHLLPTPSAVATLYADVELHVEDMAISTDEPLIPEDFHWLLMSGALVKEYEKREKVAFVDREMARFNKGVQDLQAFINRKFGPQVNSTRPRRFSQLGSMFPDGT